MKKVKKLYNVEFDFECVDIKVMATGKRDAKKKALAKLQRKNPVSFIRRDWPKHRRMIDAEEV